MNLFRNATTQAAFFLLFSPFFLSPQQSQLLTQQLPLEQGLIMGQLDNGLTYYIKQNKKPEHHCLLSLALRVGSLAEQSHERGLAHFVEHLAFKGSSQFQDYKQLMQYFSDRGVQCGADQNAHTGLEETVYTLALPANDDELMDRSIRWLSDVAGRLPLTDDAIESERSIILDELQFRNNVSDRTLKLLYNEFSGKLAVGDRFPAGLAEVISGASADTIRNFYKTWYRPELMAIIFVGDYEPLHVKQLIEQHFSALPAKNGPQPPTATMNDLQQQLMVNHDHERTSNSCAIIASIPRIILNTQADVKENLISSILQACLNQRLTQQSSNPASHFSMLCSYYSPSLYDRTLFQLHGNFKTGHATLACSELFYTYNQLLAGVSSAEVESARSALAAQNNLFIANYATQEHQAFYDNFIHHFLHGGSAMICDGIAYARQAQTILDDITPKDVNDSIDATLGTASNCIFYRINDAELGNANKEALTQQLENELIKAKQQSITAHQYEQKQLPPAFPTTTQGSSSVEDIALIDAYKITLSNGITVYFKQTAYQEDEISLSGMARGGSLHFIGKEYQAENCCGLIGYTGIGGLLPHEVSDSLRKYQDVSTSCALTPQWREVSASSRKINFSTALELLYCTCTRLNFNPAQFALLKEDLHRSIDNTKDAPGIQLGYLFNERTKIHDRFFKRPTHEEVDSFDEQIMHDIFTTCFNHWSDFTFVVSGNIALAEIRELLENTLGKLPQSNPQQLTQEPVYLGFTSVNQETLPQRSEKQCMTLVASPMQLPINEETNILLSILKNILNIRLTHVLRIEKNLAYVTSMGFTRENDLGFDTIDATARLQLTLSCAPENVDELIKNALAVLRTAADDGFTNEELAQAQKILQTQFDRGMQSDSFWHQHILRGLFKCRGIESVDTRKDRITNITLDQLNAFYREHVQLDTCYALTMLPKDPAAKTATGA